MFLKKSLISDLNSGTFLALFIQVLSKFVTPEIADTTTTHLFSFLTISIILLIQN